MADAPVVLAITALPTTVDGPGFVRTLLAQRVIACGTILGEGRSFYHWEGTVEDATETVLLLKTTSDQVAPLREALTALHPYQVPELLVFPATDGLPAYLGWVRAEVTRPAPGPVARDGDSIV